MFCINCFNPTTSVKNTRAKKNQPQIWRRRYCPNCKSVFTTYERPSLSDNGTVHRDNKKTEPFNLGKLIISVAAAFSHSTDEAKYQSFWIAQTIEDILSTQYKTITPEVISAVTHQCLKRFDEVAAMQYALKHQMLTSTKRRPGRPALS